MFTHIFADSLAASDLFPIKQHKRMLRIAARRYSFFVDFMSPPSGHGQQFNSTMTKTSSVPGAADQKNDENFHELQKKMDQVGKEKDSKPKKNEKNQQMDETD